MSINQNNIKHYNINLVQNFREERESSEINAYGSKIILYRVQCRVGMEESELSQIINNAHNLLVGEYSEQGGLSKITSSVVLIIGHDKKVESIDLLKHEDNTRIVLDQSIVSRVNTAVDNHPLTDQPSVKPEAQGDLQSSQSSTEEPVSQQQSPELPEVDSKPSLDIHPLVHQPLVSTDKESKEEKEVSSSSRTKRNIDSPDDIEDYYGSFDFNHEGTRYSVWHDGFFSKGEKEQIVQNIRGSHELLVAEYNDLHGKPPHGGATIFIGYGKANELNDIYYGVMQQEYRSPDPSFLTKKGEQDPSEDSHSTKESDPGLTVSKPKEVLPELEQPTLKEGKSSVEPQGESEKPVIQQADVQLPRVEHAYEEFRGGLGFEHQDVQYYVSHSNNLSKEEKDTIIGDVKNSHESLVNKYGELSKMQSSDCISVIIGINSDKKISAITSRGSKSDSIDLEPSLISGNNPEEEASVVNPNPPKVEPTELASSNSPTEGIQLSQANANSPALDTQPIAASEGELQGESEEVADLSQVDEELAVDPQSPIIEEQPRGDLPKITEPTPGPKVELDQNREEKPLGDQPQVPLIDELQSSGAEQETQSSDVGLISSFIYILTKPLSLALSAITSVISWVFGFDEKEPDATHHDNNHALSEPSAGEASEESYATHRSAPPEPSLDEVPDHNSPFTQ